MKRILTLLLLLCVLQSYSQKITIKGTAFDTTKGRNWVRVVVNDTLQKILDRKPVAYDVYQKLTKDTTIMVFARDDGRFQLSVNKTDSLSFESNRHVKKRYYVSDLLQMEQINIQLEPEICIPYVPCHETTPSAFYVFVGRKIQVEYENIPYYCNTFIMDSKFKATYNILQQQVGAFPRDTITFDVYDHYGIPAFSRYENVLIFVAEYCGQLYHQKYQYFDVYKTADGNWASPGDPYKYDNYHRKNLKAQPIRFAESVWFNLSGLSKEDINARFPQPFYKIEENKAIPIMGAYINTLIEVKKEGVLKASGLFKIDNRE